MSIKIADRVKETSLTQGTGTLTLNGAFGGFQSFSSAIGDGNSTYYAIENESKWEVGIGTYTSSSNTLSRDTVLKSSSGTSKITISGVAIVFCSYPADKAVIRDENGNIPEDGLLTLTRDSAGNFIHMYKDDSYDRTISIYTDGNASPEWRMGVKNSPSSETEAPSEGYVYGKDGQVGLVGNSSNSITLDNTTNFTVKHNNVSLIEASASAGINLNAKGIHLNANSAAYPAITINGAAAQSQPLTEWTDSAGNVLSIVDKDGNIAINKTSASYELDVDGSGRLESVYLTSGIYFQDGTFQTTAHSDVLTNQVSGWADNTITSRDNAVSGYFETRTDQNTNDIVLVSGIAAYASGHNLQSITDNGSSTTNSISSSGNVTATTGILDVLDLTLLENGSQPSYSEGVVFYDSENHTLSLYNDEADVTLQLGQEEFLRVRNNTGGTIYNGSGVRIVGAHGNAAPTVEPAIASTEQKSQIVGLATHDIENNSFGYVTTYGVVRDVNTVGFSAGDELFLDASASGNLTNIPPTIPNYKVSVGHVVRSHANGSVLVQIGHPKLGGGDLKSEAAVTLSGVPFATSIANTNAGGMQTNSSFVYDSGNNQLQLGSGVQLLNAVPGNTTNVLYNDGGTLKFNGSAIAGAGDVTTEQLEGVSGIAVYASGQTDNNTADILTVSGLLYDDASLSGYVDSRDTAVSGWAKAYVDSQDHSATAVSGWANATFVTSDNDTTYTAGSGLELHGTEFQASISGANLLATNTPTDDYVPSYDAATGKLTWVANAGDVGATYTAGSGLVLDGDNKFHSTFASGNYLLGEIRDNSSSGVVISGIANTNVSNIASNLVEIRANSASGVVISGIAETAYGWGDHSLQSYSTSDTTYTPGSGLELHGTAFQTAISGANLLATNTPSDNQLASYDAATGKFTWVSAGAGGENNEFSFKTISVAGQSGVVADTTTDTLTLAAGSNVTITTNAGTDTITITSTDTTYSVEDGGLTTNDFTTADHSKLDGIETSANNYSLPSASDTVVGGVELATTTETTTGTDTTRAVTPAGVQAAIDALIGGAPGALDTLNELAAAISDDASYASTITTALSAKAPIASPTFTGTVAIPNVADLETAVVANTAKLTNVSTALSTGTVDATSYGITSDGGSDDIVLAQATTSAAGLLSAAKWDEIVANTAKDTANTANVEAAGALMDSELTDLAGVKAVTISTLQVKPSEGAFVDGDKTKLDAIEASATADQSNAEIVAAVEAGTDSNTFTDADHSKLDGIEASADVTDTANVTTAGALMDSELTTIALVKGLTAGISDGNVLTANDVVADDDFLRINGTEVEGRSASEVLSDIAAAPAAGSSSVVTVGTVTAGTWQGTAIAQAYIADNAISLAKMAGLARGSIIIGDSGDDPKALAAGTEDYVLTMDSNGDAVWAAAGGGGGGDITGVTLAGDSGTAEDLTANVNLTIAGGNGITTTGSSATLTVAVDAAQPTVTSLGTLTTLTVDSIIINGTTIGHTSDTDAIAIASGGDVTFSQTVTSNGYKMSSGGYTTITGTSHTLAEADDGKVLLFTNGDPIALTVPAGLTLGHSCTVIQQGAGQITFTPSSTTIRNRQSHTKTAGQYARVGLFHYQESSTSNFYNLGGDTAS